MIGTGAELKCDQGCVADASENDLESDASHVMINFRTQERALRSLATIL